MMVPLAAAALASATVPLPCEPAGVSAAKAADAVLISCGHSSDFVVVNDRSGRLLARIHPLGHDGVEHNDSAISADGQYVAGAWRDGSVEVWKTGSAEPVVTWKAPFYANTLSFTPGNRALMVNDLLLDLQTGKPTGQSFGGNFDAANDVAYSGDGRLAAVSEADTTVRLFDVASGRERARYNGLVVEPFGIDFAPGGGLFVGTPTAVEQLGRDLSLVRSYPVPPGFGAMRVLSRNNAVLVALIPLAGDAPPMVRLLDLKSGQWTAAPELDGAVEAKRTSRGVAGYWLDGRSLIRREIALPK